MHALTHYGVPAHTKHRTSAAPGPIMADLYPNMKVVPSSNANLLTKLGEGECDAAVAVKDSFAIQKRLKKYNEDCNLHKTGDTIYPASAGWAVASDSGIKCTSIIRDAIDIFMVLAHFPSPNAPSSPCLIKDGHAAGGYTHTHTRSHTHTHAHTCMHMHIILSLAHT